MYLIGSKGMGVDNELSDYDYIEVDLIGGKTHKDIINERIGANFHCYHYNKEYIEKLGKYEIDDPEDFLFIFNPEHYNAGANPINPFDYKEKWIEKLKTTDFLVKPFYYKKTDKFGKFFYHIVFNLECLKQNTLHPILDNVKKYHDRKMPYEEYIKVLKEIKDLK